MEITVTKITPKLAEKWLGKNTKNRNIKPGHVARLARDMSAGHWKTNGDAIRFNGDGTLLDGQHRLTAIVKSGVTVESVVINGLSHDTQLTMDQNASRRIGDQMAVMGVKSANVTGAACRYAMILREGRWGSQQYTISELLEFYDANPGIGDYAAKCSKGPRGTQSLATCMAYVLEKTDPTEVDPFIATWSKGTGDAGNPVLMFREKLIRAYLAGQPMPFARKIRCAAWALTKTLNGETAQVMRPTETWAIPGWHKA